MNEQAPANPADAQPFPAGAERVVGGGADGSPYEPSRHGSGLEAAAGSPGNPMLPQQQLQHQRQVGVGRRGWRWQVLGRGMAAWTELFAAQTGPPACCLCRACSK